MFDLVTLITSAGYVGIAAVVFVESGLFFGFFFPGDSLLFTAGFLASQGTFDITLLILLLVIAAVLGDIAGYWFGRRVGPMLFNRKRSRFFNPEHVTRAHAFFLHHGKKAILLGRFLPIFRTFVPIVAGVATMPLKQFMAYNIIGAFAWAACLPLLGYELGSQIKNADKYLYPIVVAIIIISFIPAFWEFHKARKHKK